MRRLTIGIFVEHYEPFISGVVTSVQGLTAELERQGHVVYIICPEVRGYRDNDDRIIRVPSISTGFFDNATLGLPSRKVMKRLMGIDFDVIHSQDIYYTSATGLLLARKKNIPYVQTFHTLWHHYIEQNNVHPLFTHISAGAMVLSYPFYLGLGETGKLIGGFIASTPRKVSRLLWLHILTMSEKADAVIVPSAHLREEILKDRPAVHIHSVPNAVAAYEKSGRSFLPRKKKDHVRIVSVARFSPEKRLDTIVKAFAKTAENYELVMVGEGPDLQKIKELARDLGCDDRIIFVGQMHNGEVRHALRECDIFAISSYGFDNQPMVILEAIDAGLPIVYCDRSFREGVNENNSLLVSPQPAGFAKAFAALADEGRRKSMGRASRSLARNFHVADTSQKIADLYLDAIIRKEDVKKVYLAEATQKS